MSTYFCQRSFVVAVAATLALSVLVSACGGGGRKGQDQQDADTYLSLGKTKEAADLYTKARVADPANFAALVGIGKCFAAEGKLEEALKQFQQVIEASPENAEAYWHATDVLTMLGRDDEALELAKLFAKADPVQAALLQGQLLLMGGKPADSVAVLEASANNPGDALPKQILVALAQSSQKDTATAEKSLRDLMKNSSTSVPVRAALLDVIASGGSPAPALDDFRAFAKEHPNDDDAQSLLALASDASGDVEKAESLSREIVLRSPGSGWANYALGHTLLQKGDAKQAIDPLRRAALILPHEFIVRRDFTLARKGQATPVDQIASNNESTTQEAPKTSVENEPEWHSLWKRGDLTQLIRERDRFIKQGGENLRETLAAAAVLQNDLDLAGQIAAELPGDSPLKLFIAADRKRDAQAVLDALTPWLNRKDALGVIGQNLLAHSMSAAGIRARALQVLWACKKNFPDEGVSLLNSAMTFRQAGLPKFAARTLEQLIAQHPDSREAYILQGIALREAGDRDEALRAAQVALASFPDDTDIVLNLSQACLDARQAAEAEDVLQRARKTKPDDPRLVSALALVYLHNGAPQKALELVKGISASKDEDQGTGVIQALALAATGDWKAAEEKANTLQATGPVAVGPALAAACALKTGNREAAITLLESIKEQKRPAIRWATSVMLSALGKQAGETHSDDFDALVKDLASNETYLADFAYGTAFSWAGLPDEALTAFLRIEKASPQSTDALLPVLFDNFARSVRITDPIAPVDEVVSRHPKAKQAWLGKAHILQARGILQGQEDALNKAAELAPKDPGVFIERGMFFENSNKLYSAMDEYRKALALDAKNPVTLNNLAYCIISTKGNPEEARDLARQAIEALPNDPNILHTLGVALLRVGDLPESQKYLEKALERKPGDPTVILDFGLNLIAQGKVQEGRQQVESSVRFTEIFGLEFPRLEEAEEVLEKYPPEPQPSQKGKSV